MSRRYGNGRVLISWKRAKVVWWIVLLAGMVIRVWAQTETGPVVHMGLQKPPKVKFVFDLPDGAMQVKANNACTECHEARIILQQRLSKAAWTKEVDKMIKWGAVVDANDHDALVDYLSTNFGVDQPAYQAPRSAPAANTKPQSK
jgi:hypothetical protein